MSREDATEEYRNVQAVLWSSVSQLIDECEHLINVIDTAKSQFGTGKHPLLKYSYKRPIGARQALKIKKIERIEQPEQLKQDEKTEKLETNGQTGQIEQIELTERIGPTERMKQTEQIESPSQPHRLFFTEYTQLAQPDLDTPIPSSENEITAAQIIRQMREDRKSKPSYQAYRPNIMQSTPKRRRSLQDPFISSPKLPSAISSESSAGNPHAPSVFSIPTSMADEFAEELSLKPENKFDENGNLQQNTYQLQRWPMNDEKSQLTSISSSSSEFDSKDMTIEMEPSIQWL